MAFSATFFKNLYDTDISSREDFSSWDEFVSFFYDLSKKPLATKKDARLISPAIYKPNTSRKNINVLGWANWAAVDVDNYTVKDTIENDVNNLAGDYNYICYSTASSTKVRPKFRIVFEVEHFVQADDIRKFWYALNTQLGCVGDRQCKDLSRMYYVPADYAQSYNFIFSRSYLSPIRVADLVAKHPIIEKPKSLLESIPSQMRQDLLTYRKDQLTQKNNIKWSTYKDCPFVNKKLLKEYISMSGIDGSGRYNMIYKIMVSIASSAVKRKYPIDVYDIVSLIKEIDLDTAQIYQNRALEAEAIRAIEYAYKNNF